MASPKVTHVLTHDCLINTNPKKGVKSFVEWGQFPSKTESIRRIIMKVTLAYPEDRAIAHWDYMDRIKILRTGGKEGTNLDLNIGRMLTPYGSNFKEDWTYTWQVDVTDFSSFLRDSVEIEYIHSGYESPELGWDLTIEFEIEKGPAIADFVSLKKLWNGTFQYGNPENDIELGLAPIEISKKEKAEFGRIRIQHTGHGMDRPNGCSEFCSRWREVVFDGEVIDKRDVWKECGDNPLYPQGGTWIFDRGYWCPGDLQNPDIFQVTLQDESHIIDMNMEPFTANDINQPKEVINTYFFQYGAPNHKHDVAIEQILAPNDIQNFNRLNPRTFDPIIKIKNLGSEPLKELTIIYYTKGFDKRQYNWQGNLAFYQETEITLPGKINFNPGQNQFIVNLQSPNSKKDQWTADNQESVYFSDIPVLPNKLVVDFMTNNKPEENSLFITNSTHDTVFIKKPAALDSATLYSDTLTLAEGNYALTLTDTTGNGLEFWFMPQAGYGYLRLKDIEGNILKLFESDCGNGQFFGFTADKKASVDTSRDYLSVNIFPRMVKDNLTIYTVTPDSATLKVRITKDGTYVEEHEYTRVQESATTLSVAHLEKGRYVMEIYIDGEHKMNRRFNKVDKKPF